MDDNRKNKNQIPNWNFSKPKARVGTFSLSRAAWMVD